MSNINLLPQEVVRVKEVAEVTKALRSISMILGTITLIAGAAIGIFLFYKQKTITNLQADYDSNKVKVLSLESTENSLILVRDRIEKIKQIDSKYPFNNTLKVTNTIFEQLPQGTTLAQIAGSADKQTITLNVDGATSFKSVLETLKTNPQLKDITLTTVTKNPDEGYKITIDILNNI